MGKYSIFLILILFVSCTGFFRKKTERTLARVHDEYLYVSDIKGVVPIGITGKDSVTLVRNYIDNWIHQHLVIEQAKSNLTAEQMDFSLQMDAYKNSLIVFSYENELIKQKLDTVVNDEDIVGYYDQNQQNFLLKENIVRIRYVKLPLGTKNVKQFKKLLGSDQGEDRLLLYSQCEQYAEYYYLDDQNWLLFNDLLMQIPIKTYDQEEFLRNRQDIDFQDSAFIYLVKFKEFKIKDGVSPLSFEKEKIRNIILNKRKIELINKMQEDVFFYASKHNDFEIY